MTTPFDALFFDVDGTLLDFKLAESNALEETRLFMDSPLPPAEFRKTYHTVNDTLWLELEEGKITGKELKEERFRRFTALLKSSMDPGILSDFYLEHLGKESHFLDGAEEVIRLLAPRYPMGVITNGLIRVQKARLNRPEISKAFRSITISEETGVAKPSSEIFRIASRDLGQDLSQRVLMIGDSLYSDIAGGINAGISTCWYNPGKWTNQSPWTPDYEIEDLRELLPLLLPGD